MTSLLLGHRPPDLDKPFSYADLGCGNGFTTLVVAATCPHADVWGFDFNPAHVEFATGLAARAGLTNARFRRDVVRRTGMRCPERRPAGLRFHGFAWRAELDLAGQPRHLIGAVAKRLKPGGLVYLSYNVTTGWSAMVPVRRLMRMLALASPERTDSRCPACWTSSIG